MLYRLSRASLKTADAMSYRDPGGKRATASKSPRSCCLQQQAQLQYSSGGSARGATAQTSSTSLSNSSTPMGGCDLHRWLLTIQGARRRALMGRLRLHIQVGTSSSLSTIAFGFTR